MLAFRPDDGSNKNTTTTNNTSAASNTITKITPASSQLSESKNEAPNNIVESVGSMRVEEKQPDVVDRNTEQQAVTEKVQIHSANKISLAELSSANWHEVVTTLNAAGILKQLVNHTAFMSVEKSHFYLALTPSHAAMLTAEREQQLQDKLSTYFDSTINLHIEKTQIETETPAARSDRQKQERQTAAESSIVNDDNVKNIMDAFNANIDIESVQPIDSATEKT